MNSPTAALYIPKPGRRFALILCTVLVGLFMFGFAAPVFAGNEEEEEDEPAQITQEQCEAEGGVYDEQRSPTEPCYYPDVVPQDPDFFFNTYLNPLINFLAAVTGLMVTISLVMGGIQWSASGDDPQKVAKARSKIFNSVIALIAFLFLYSFLQWLVPGGIFE